MNNPKTNFTFDDFPVGRRVKVVSKCVDFYFWYGETGTVTKNKGRYLGITVKLDKPRHFDDDSIYVQTEFNFNPDNLAPMDCPEEYQTHDEEEFWR